MTSPRLHRVWRGPCLALLLGLAWPLAASARPPAAPALEKEYQRLLAQCRNDPQYRVGGAMTGECVEQETLRRDLLIEAALQRIAASHCPSVGAALAAAQRHWEQYRSAQCGLFQAMFDNTAMYLNGTACALRATLAREADLRMLVDYAPGSAAPCKADEVPAPMPGVAAQP